MPSKKFSVGRRSDFFQPSGMPDKTDKTLSLYVTHCASCYLDYQFWWLHSVLVGYIGGNRLICLLRLGERGSVEKISVEWSGKNFCGRSAGGWNTGTATPFTRTAEIPRHPRFDSAHALAFTADGGSLGPVLPTGRDGGPLAAVCRAVGSACGADGVCSPAGHLPSCGGRRGGGDQRSSSRLPSGVLQWRCFFDGSRFEMRKRDFSAFSVLACRRSRTTIHRLLLFQKNILGAAKKKPRERFPERTQCESPLPAVGIEQRTSEFCTQPVPCVQKRLFVS